MLIVAIAWIYVVLLMAIAEPGVTAGILTFVLYCGLPMGFILYLIKKSDRKRKRRDPEQPNGSSGPENPEN